jgi:hypothetical protein
MPDSTVRFFFIDNVHDLMNILVGGTRAQQVIAISIRDRGMGLWEAKWRRSRSRLVGRSPGGTGFDLHVTTFSWGAVIIR